MHNRVWSVMRRGLGTMTKGVSVDSSSPRSRCIQHLDQTDLYFSGLDLTSSCPLSWQLFAHVCTESTSFKICWVLTNTVQCCNLYVLCTLFTSTNLPYTEVCNFLVIYLAGFPLSFEHNASKWTQCPRMFLKFTRPKNQHCVVFIILCRTAEFGRQLY